MNGLVDAGFTLRRALDWRPSEDQVRADPSLSDEVDRPMFLVLAAVR